MTAETLTASFLASLPKGGSELDDAFAAFEAKNRLLPVLIELCEQAKSAGRKRLGMKFLVEKVRWDREIVARGGSFRVNNSFTSRYTRSLIAARPDLASMFRTRKAKTIEAPPMTLPAPVTPLLPPSPPISVAKPVPAPVAVPFRPVPAPVAVPFIPAPVAAARPPLPFTPKMAPVATQVVPPGVTPPIPGLVTPRPVAAPVRVKPPPTTNTRIAPPGHFPPPMVITSGRPQASRAPTPAAPRPAPLPFPVPPQGAWQDPAATAYAAALLQRVLQGARS